jgi:membrane protein implicated in regulation of membrane protease activity
MAIQYWWWLAAIALGIAELFTGSFYLLVLAAGAAGAGLTAALGFGLASQLLCAALISAIGAALVRKLRPLNREAQPSQRNPDVNLDIGQTVQVEQWDANRHARVAYRGAMWDVELLAGEPALPGRFVIREIDGSRLRLSSGSRTDVFARAADNPPSGPAIGQTDRSNQLRTAR